MFDSDPMSCPLQTAINEQILAIESEGRYNGVTATVLQVNGLDRIVFRDATGKLVKPCTFKEFNV